MASITIRNLDEDVKTRLRMRAAGRGRSMEEEARTILRDAVHREEAGPRNLAAFTRDCFAPLGGVELELPPRGSMREPPDFSQAAHRMFVKRRLAEAGRDLVRDPVWGKWGDRIVACLVLDGKPQSKILIEVGHGRTYHGGKR